jgi:ribosome biogenesis GTPase
VNSVHELRSAGFGPFFFSQLQLDELDPARIGRVVLCAREMAFVRVGEADRLAHSFVHAVVGDWVVVDPGDPLVIRRVLDRHTALRRRDADGVHAQVLAANVDRALICSPCDQPPNVRRLERWLAIAADAGVEPIVVLTKADVGDADAAHDAYAFAGVPVLRVSALRDEGRDALIDRLEPGSTATLLGLSGAGKSTLLNWVVGQDVRDTGPVRGDHKGRHTTSDRHLFRMPNGAWLLDNPGVRTVGVVGDEGVAAVFPEVEAASANCRWRDCDHDQEPDCGIVAAVEAGEVDPERFAAWRKLQRELAYELRKDDPAARRAELDRWKRIHKAAKARRRFEDRQR